MPKEDWGVKRLCPTTGKRFYDLNRSPIISPYTGEEVVIETGRKSSVSLTRDKKAVAEKKKPAPAETDEVTDLEDNDAEVELDDDVLDDDDDDDTVALDDLADVAAEGKDDD